MNYEAAKVFSQVILAEKTVHIKLLGDSITHGVGGTGFEQDGPVIVEGWARNPNGYCWANRMKAYLEENFSCVVTNNACTGTDIEFILRHFDTLVDGDDDIIICTIGTNNRHQFFETGVKRTVEEMKQTFFANVLKLYDRFREAGKAVIFVANIPAALENEKDGENYWRILHMNDIEDVYQKAAFVRGFPLIRLYSLFLGDCLARGVTVDSLLADGLHPNDEGFDVMYRLLLEELGIAVPMAQL